MTEKPKELYPWSNTFSCTSLGFPIFTPKYYFDFLLLIHMLGLYLTYTRKNSCFIPV